MRLLLPEAALAAALLATGCAGEAASLRKEVEALRSELTASRAETQDLRRTVEGLSGRVDAVTARLARAGDARPEPRTEPRAEQRPVDPGHVPGGLTVIKVEPPRPVASPTVPAGQGSGASPARRAPPVPTGVAIVEPDEARLEAVGRRGGRELSTEAEAELKAARKREGLARAHALEDFTARYPRHPQADNALVEAATAYAEAGRADAACTVARRAVGEYPAGDAVPDALWRVAACEAPRSPESEKQILTRLVTEHPSTPAARRAGARLAAISGRGGDVPPEAPARSGP